jgi:DNA-binding PadR family transcriptional regulator
MANADSTKERSDTADEPAIDTQVTTEQKVTPQDLTLFQQEILLILARKGPSYGLAIKRELEDLYDQEVNHGRLYPNLDTLVDDDLIEKGERDKRTNDYRLSDAGRYLVRQDAQRRYLIAEDLNSDGDEDEKKLIADDGTVPDDAEHWPNGFHSGGRHVLDGGAEPDYVPIENRCVDCGEEAHNSCGNCGMPLCGRHNEVQGGFCSHFTETPYPVCVWGEDVFVFEGNAADHEVLVTDRTRSDVYHLLHASETGDDNGTSPLCRPIEDGKECVAMRDLDDDVELCGLCEEKLIALADDDGTEEGDP